MSDYTLITGGAKGSDLHWQEGALSRGMNVRIMSFQGHKYSTPECYRTDSRLNIELLNDESLEEARVHAEKANERLQRTFPCNKDFTTNLIARNYHIVKDAEAVVAIGEVNGDIVEGGTGWTTTMADDMGKDVYVYDMKSRRWYKYKTGMLQPCERPCLPKTFAGVGSRSLCEEGKCAIDRVLESVDRHNKEEK